MTTLPKEYEQRIEQEATHHANVEIGDIGKITDMHTVTKWDACKDDYTAGATRYATHYHTLQQENERLRKVLEELADFPLYMSITEVRSIANGALTAQPEGDKQTK